MGSLVSYIIMGSWRGRDRVAALNHQRKDGHGYHKGHQGWSGNQQVWATGIVGTVKLIWGPQEQHRGGHSINSFLNLYNQRNSTLDLANISLTWINAVETLDQEQFQDSKLFERKESWKPLRKNLEVLPQVCLSSLSRGVLPMAISQVTVQWEKEIPRPFSEIIEHWLGA